jgi:hypothetical protein
MSLLLTLKADMGADIRDFAFGSRAEELKVSTTSPLYPEKQTLARAAGMSH